LRVVPLAVVESPLNSRRFQISDLASAAFEAAALARVLAKFPDKAGELRSVAIPLSVPQQALASLLPPQATPRPTQR
jgi:hypothetical protein